METETIKPDGTVEIITTTVQKQIRTKDDLVKERDELTGYMTTVRDEATKQATKIKTRIDKINNLLAQLQ